MREGSLDAPIRHPLGWEKPEFYDEQALDDELRRVFDICHGCRRCFNLCDSFPKLFDMIDESESGELDTVASDQFGPVIDACTLCDMCFMTKCPYVPPHEFNLDFPHLMLRTKAIEFKKGERSFADKQLAQTDRNGELATLVSSVANYSTKTGGALRAVLNTVTGIDPQADLPTYAPLPLTKALGPVMPQPNPDAPGYGRRVAIYTTCFGNFNDQTSARAAVHVLAHNGVALSLSHPGCCGMPRLENGDIQGVAEQARKVIDALLPLVDDGQDIVTLTPSCTLMLKFEWPLILPDDDGAKRLAAATYDLSEYVMDIAKGPGLTPGMAPIGGAIAVHFACHSRAQNVGPRALDMLKLIPEAKPGLVERCSGHGGKWGYFKSNYETAIKVGKPAARALAKQNPDYVVTECPLAGPHLRQVMEAVDSASVPERVGHPIELVAKAYGLEF